MRILRPIFSILSLIFTLAALLAACIPPGRITQRAPSLTPAASSTLTRSPSPTFTSFPSPTSTPLAGPTLTPSPTSSLSPAGGLLFKRTAQSSGSIQGIAIAGDIAYVGMGPRVAAIDISQHADPRLAGQSPPLPGQVTHLLMIAAAPYPALLAGAGKYLVVLDTSNPETLAPARQLALPGSISAMVLDSSELILYIGGSIYQAPHLYSGFIAAVDISPQEGPTMLDSVSLSEQPISIALAKGMVYAGTEGDDGGLYSVPREATGDLSLPRLVIRSSTANYLPPYSMQVIGNRLYVGTYMSMQAFDLHNPDQPVQAWKVEHSENLPLGMVIDFSVDGDKVFAFGWYPAGSYLPYRLAFAPPEPLTGSPIGEVASTVALHDGDFLVANFALEIYDTGDPQDLRLAGAYRPPVVSVLGAAIANRAVYVVDNGVPDGRNPAVLRAFRLPSLEPLGQVTTEYSGSWGWFRSFAVESNRAYLATIDGLWIYDLNRMAQTQWEEPAPAHGQLEAITAAQVGNRRMLFASRQVGDSSVLSAYDLTDLQRPTTTGAPLTLDSGTIIQMAWNGAYLYAISTAIREGERDLLYIIDFHEDTLALRGSLQLPVRLLSLAVNGERVALAGTDGLFIVSAASPESPRLLAQAPLPELGMRVSIQGDRALVVAAGYLGAAQLLVFDIQDPANPQQVEGLDIAFKDTSIGPMPVSDPYIVLAGGSSGIEVLEYHARK